MTLIYYVVWWSGRWLSPVDDPEPPGFNATLQSAGLDLYTGEARYLVRARTVLVHASRLSAGDLDYARTAIQLSWNRFNQSQ